MLMCQLCVLLLTEDAAVQGQGVFSEDMCYSVARVNEHPRFGHVRNPGAVSPLLSVVHGRRGVVNSLRTAKAEHPGEL